MVPKDLYWCTTKMWAVLGEDQTTVTSVIMPDTPYEEVLIEAENNTLILVTEETGNGYIPGYYKDGKFFKGRVGFN